jgi:hypothetical protein
MGIRVVDSHDALISCPRSFLRYSVLGAPYFLNGALISPQILTGWVAVATSVVVFGMGLSIVYLFVFNRRNRRSLHDLIAGTYVIKAAGFSSVEKRRTWPGHYVVVILLFSASIVAPFLLRPLADKTPFRELLTLQKDLVAQPDVRAAALNAGTTVFWGTGGKQNSTYLVATIHSARRIDDYDAFAAKMAQVIFENYPDAIRKDRVVITISYGYDIGLAWANLQRGYNLSPAEWRERIKPSSAR